MLPAPIRDKRLAILVRAMRWVPLILVLPLSFSLLAQSNPDSTAQQANPAAAAPQSPPFITCPAGAPLGAVDLQVQAGDQRLPFRTINHLSEGDTLLYAPILRGKEKRPGEVALVLVPEKRESGQEDILVTEPKPADKPQSWKMPRTISVAAVVYGPSGLNRKKVAQFLSRDEVLIAQLADYADKTAQAEQLVATLSNSESSSASVNAALSGFASQYGFAVQINRSAPVAAQAETVFAAMNPQLSAYNPLASSTAQRAGQTASLATMAGTLFFGSPIGLAAGGTAMLLDLRAIAFPDTQFRASFAQQLPGSPVNLCGQQGPLPPHTRVAYIWASRIPNISAPKIGIGDADYLPATQKTPLPVDVPEPGWKYLDRTRNWTLVDGSKRLPIAVVKLSNQHALEVDLTKANIAAGDYKLTGLWDWAPFEAAGTVHVLPLDDFKKAHLNPASQDRLLAKSGKVPVTLTGGDFEFITEVQLQKLHDEFAMPEAVRFLLPKGPRKGPQDHMDVQVDTQNLDPGGYKLLLSQQDGHSHAVDFKVLPNPPRLANLPILINQGAGTQHYVLKGERLEQISRLETPGAILNLSPPGANQTERGVTVELKSSPRPGTDLPLKAYVEDRSEPMTFPGAIEITGPLPVIASSKRSLPQGLAIKIHADEFPAGYTLNATLDVRNIERQSVLRLACSDGLGEHAALHIGEQTTTWNLQQLSVDQLFLAFDTSGLPAGCALQAVVDNGRDGSSQPFSLLHIIRVPQIDSFTLAGASQQNATPPYQITGRNLEMIEKVGWDENRGLDVSGLPAPLPGPGLKQSIEVNLPDVLNPDGPLYVWLRGDKQGRVTTIKPPALPAPGGQPQSASSGPAANDIARQTTTATLSSSPGPAYSGQSVTLVAKVAPATATGVVIFLAGQTSLGTAALNSGQASLTTSKLPAGSLSIVAVYGGDATYAGCSSPPVPLTVAKRETSTSLTSAPNPSTGNQGVELTAIVAATRPAGASPTGTVTFLVDNTSPETVTLSANGVATFRASRLGPGKYEVKAVYNGSPDFAESSSAMITQVIQ